MTMFQTIAALVSLAAIASYVNHRFVRLPTTIGLMTIALVLSLSLVALDKFDIIEHAKAVAFVRSIDFSEIVLDGLLAFFLFAGALHVNLADLSRQKLPVAVLSTVGVVISTFVVGALVWMAARHQVSVCVRSVVWRFDFSNGPDCSARYSEKASGAQEPGNDDYR
jgi:monovalent cation:H+ antiporter, CPA1 family